MHCSSHICRCEILLDPLYLALSNIFLMWSIIVYSTFSFCVACVCFALLCGARVPCSFVRRACTPKPTRSERVLGTDYCISWACELRGVCSRRMRSALIVLSIRFHLFVLFWHTGRILPEQLLGFVDSVVFCPILKYVMLFCAVLSPRTRSNSSHDLKHFRT